MFCTQCGAKLPQGARFCPHCRAQVSSEALDRMAVSSLGAQQESDEYGSIDRFVTSRTAQDSHADAQVASDNNTSLAEDSLQQTRVMTSDELQEEAMVDHHEGDCMDATTILSSASPSNAPAQLEVTDGECDDDLSHQEAVQTAINALGVTEGIQVMDGENIEGILSHQQNEYVDQTMALPVVKQPVTAPSNRYTDDKKDRGNQMIIIAAVLGALIVVLIATLGYFGYQTHVQHQDAERLQQEAAQKDEADKEKAQQEKQAREQEKQKQQQAQTPAPSTAEQTSGKQQSYTLLNSYYTTLGTQSSKIAGFAQSFNAVLDKSKAERSSLLTQMRDYQSAMAGDRKSIESASIDSSYSATKDKLLKLASYNERRLNAMIAALDRSMAYDDPSDYHDTILEPLAAEHKNGSNKSEALVLFEQEYPSAQPAKP